MAKYTPMIEQYLDVKKQCQDMILFFRLGDFYEMFFDDARLAARELEITLTSRDGGLDERVPMCGIPYHAADNYISKLIAKGYKVAICEQLEDPKQAKGIVKRDIIRVVTPGTAITDAVLDDKQNNYLACVSTNGNDFLLAVTDISTGELSLGQYSGRDAQLQLTDELYRMKPKELILVEPLEQNRKLIQFVKQLVNCALTVVQDPQHLSFHQPELQSTFPGLMSNPVAVTLLNGHTAALSLLLYLQRTQKCELNHINNLSVYAPRDFMQLDVMTQRNLELTASIRDGRRKGTLLSVLDFTLTAMGGRCLRKWIEQPVKALAEIQLRQDVIEEFVQQQGLRVELQEQLHNIYDLERLIGKLAFATANARDLLSLKQSLAVLPTIKHCCLEAKAIRLNQLGNQLLLMEDMTALIEQAICDDPPFSVREGKMIRTGYNAELDELRGISRHAKDYLNLLEQQEKQKTGIKSLKLSFNKVFGYYIEVTNANLENVPEHYIRKQTLVNAERFITPELKELESKILGANERIVQLEYELFCKLREALMSRIEDMQNASRVIAQLDALLSLAEAAVQHRYVKPCVKDHGGIVIKEGRHPVVECLRQDDLFVPNDTELDHDQREIIVLTGPNMAGKSTYMRQVALIVLMAQIGSFVPAASANIGIVDRIFTRVGASDDLAMGQSTFMVEMAEVAHILKHATKASLIILDEVGRGTSTFDGLSIAQAVVEHIALHIHAQTLFATHYHELTALELRFDNVMNYSVAVKEKGDQIVFLRRIMRGGTDRSYGIHVARLAGLPTYILERAQTLLEGLENERFCRNQAAATDPGLSIIEEQQDSPTQASLFDPGPQLVEELLNIDVMTLTPIEALNVLYHLQTTAKQGQGD